MMKQYNVKNLSLTSVLRLNEPNIIEILQKKVYKVFFNQFSYQTKKKKTLVNSLKRKSEELEKIIVDDKENAIACRIRLEEYGKHIALKSIQALMVAHEENKLELYNANRNVKWLKTKITQLQNKGSNLSAEINLKQKSEEIKMSVNNILDEKKLGSVIFISTE